MLSASVKEITPRTFADLMPRASPSAGEPHGSRPACPHQPWTTGSLAQPPPRPSGMVYEKGTFPRHRTLFYDGLRAVGGRRVEGQHRALIIGEND